MTIPSSYPYPSSHAHSHASALQRRRFSRTDALQALHRGTCPPAVRGASRGRGRGGPTTLYARPAPGIESRGDVRLHQWPPKRSNVWIAPALASSKSQVAAAATPRAEVPRGRLEERVWSREENDAGNLAEGQSHHDGPGVKRARRDNAPLPTMSKAPASASTLLLWEREIETREEAARVHARRGEREKWVRNRDALEWLRARVAVVKEDKQRQRLVGTEEAVRAEGEESQDERRDESNEKEESFGGSGQGDDREEGEWEEIEISDEMRRVRDGQRRKEEEEAGEALYMYGDAASDVEDQLDYGWGLERSDY